MNSRWRTVGLVVGVCGAMSMAAHIHGFAQEAGQGSHPEPPRQGRPPQLASRPPQGFAFKWWQDARFKAELGLTNDQIRQAEDIFQGVLPRMTADKEVVDRLEKRLSEIIVAGVLPENDVIQLIDQVETARAKLGKVRTLMTYRLRQMLTPDQRAKMKAMQDAWERERRQGQVRKRPQGMPREGGLL